MSITKLIIINHIVMCFITSSKKKIYSFFFSLLQNNIIQYNFSENLSLDA